MKPQILFRKIHHWGAITIALPVVIMIGAGILLTVKKEFDWLQPPSQKGVEISTMPTASMQQMFDAVIAVEQAGIEKWTDLDRVDFKNDKGIAKFIATNNWEVQVDTSTAKVLQVAYRRSDTIEKIHDGTYFADWVKLWLFLPVGIGLFTLWLTGIYLFFLPHYKKWQKRHRKKRGPLAH